MFFECFNCKCFQTTKTFSLLNDREEREREGRKLEIDRVVKRILSSSRNQSTVHVWHCVCTMRKRRKCTFMIEAKDNTIRNN